MRVKDLDTLKLPPTPVSAAQARGYTNLVLLRISAYDKAQEDLLFKWACKALDAEKADELHDAEGFPRLDRAIVTKVLESTKSGQLGLHF